MKTSTTGTVATTGAPTLPVARRYRVSCSYKIQTSSRISVKLKNPITETVFIQLLTIIWVNNRDFAELESEQSFLKKLIMP